MVHSARPAGSSNRRGNSRSRSVEPCVNGFVFFALSQWTPTPFPILSNLNSVTALQVSRVKRHVLWCPGVMKACSIHSRETGAQLPSRGETLPFPTSPFSPEAHPRSPCDDRR